MNRYKYFAIGYLLCLGTWTLAIVVNPFLEPMVRGLNNYDAIKEVLDGQSFVYSAAILAAFYCGNLLICTWVLRNGVQIIFWAAVLGIYVATMYLPSHNAQIVSEWLGNHMLKPLALIVDVSLLIGVPLIIALIVREIPIGKEE